MGNTTLDPVISAVRNSLRFDRANNQLYFLEEKLPGDNFAEWRAALAPRLYAQYHAGCPQTNDGVEALLSDVVVDELIVKSTPLQFRDSRAPVDSVKFNDKGDELGVYALIGALKVFIPNERILTRDDKEVHFRTRTLRPRLSAGFMFFIGSDRLAYRDRLFRIYCGATDPNSLLPTWAKLIHFITRTQAPIRMKMLSRLSEYPRRDALVLYVDEDAWELVPEVLEILESGGDTSIGPEEARFAKKLTPNIMCAWEPHDRSVPLGKESFGQQRSRRIAEGVVRELELGDTGGTAVMSALVEGNIDPAAVYRNLDSPKIPIWSGEA